jgi:hypothetical protein
MPRTISSRLTVLYKFIYPAVSILVGVFALFQILRMGFLKSSPTLIIFLPFFALLGGVSLWPMIRLKKVSLDDEFLYVSNYLKEIKIPLDDIYDMTENRWIKFHPVTIYLRRPSEFGTKIVFAPTFRMFIFFTSHPIVEELRQWLGQKVYRIFFSALNLWCNDSGSL